MEKAPRRKSMMLRWILGLAVASALYVLSVGPYRFAYDKGWISEHVVGVAEILYFPLIWVGEKSPDIEAAFQVYSDWWAKLARR